MAESSCFRKTVDLIKQGAIYILMVVFLTAGAIAGVLLVIICPSIFYFDDDDDDEDVADIIFGILAIFHMLVDALFMYVPLINEESKCVMLDNRLKIAAIVLRSLADLHYVVRIYARIKRGLQNNDQEMTSRRDADKEKIANDKEMTSRRDEDKEKIANDKEMTSRVNGRQNLPLAMSVAIDTVCILPVPQTPEFEPPKWFGIAVNILGYILASHVLGAFWYFFSIQREIDCWGYACRIENRCEFSTSCVEKTFRNITHINNLCLVNLPNATVFDFGIFLYALQSGMQGSANFPEKFLQCFSWGLRNLSSFASNLNSSTYGWENLFVVVICISGLVLFMYLLGHSQTYMQETDRRDNIKRKMKMIMEPKIRLLLSDFRVPTREMEWKIMWAVELILEKDEDFILESMFSILSCNLPVLLKGRYLEGLDLEIKRMLFLDKLKKVDGLKDKDEGVLEKISEHLERMIYTEGSYIIREGEPLDMMFFITQGTVLTYATNDEGNFKVIEKEKDCCYGEELLTLAEWTSSKLFTLPVSTFNVKSQNKVEIFALKATDLPNVVSKFPGHSNTNHMEIVSA